MLVWSNPRVNDAHCLLRLAGILAGFGRTDLEMKVLLKLCLLIESLYFLPWMARTAERHFDYLPLFRFEHRWSRQKENVRDL